MRFSRALLFAAALLSISTAIAGSPAKGVAKVGLGVVGSSLPMKTYQVEIDATPYPFADLVDFSDGTGDTRAYQPGKPKYDDIKLSFWYGEGGTDTEGFTALVESFLDSSRYRRFNAVIPLGGLGDTPNLALGLLDCMYTSVTLPGLDLGSTGMARLGSVMQANGSLVRAASEFNLLKMEDMKRVRSQSTISSARMKELDGKALPDVTYVSPIVINISDINGDGLLDLAPQPFIVRVARGGEGEKMWDAFYQASKADPAFSLNTKIDYVTIDGLPAATATLQGLGFLGCSKDVERGITISTSHVEYRCYVQKASYGGKPGIGHPN